MRHQRSGVVIAAILLVGSISGCGGGGGVELLPAKGIVKLQGAPLAGARVTFIPESGPAAMGTTDTEGKFELFTGTLAGVVAGKCGVSVEMNDPSAKGGLSENMTPEDMQKMQMEGKLESKMAAQNKSLIPEHYSAASKSGLSFEVKKGDANEFTIELKK